MDAVEPLASAPPNAESQVSFAQEFRIYWDKLPDKGFFLGLLAAWCLLFQFFGVNFNTLGTNSLFYWLYSAWNTPSLDSSQGNLIPIVVLILLWVRRRELAASITGWWWPPIALLGLSLFLHVFGFLAEQIRLSIIALFVGPYALVGLVWGWRVMKATFFPFVLFAFCMPLGTSIQYLTFPMRLFATDATVVICRDILGIPILQHGTELFDKSGTFNFDVAPACSGIHSLVALLAVTTVFSVLYFKKFWRRALMIFLGFPLVVFFNIMRLVAIILATQSINKQAGIFVHEWFGFVTYTLSVVCLLAVASILKEKPLNGTA
jgi:exosortase